MHLRFDLMPQNIKWMTIVVLTGVLYMFNIFQQRKSNKYNEEIKLILKMTATVHKLITLERRQNCSSQEASRQYGEILTDELMRL